MLAILLSARRSACALDGPCATCREMMRAPLLCLACLACGSPRGSTIPAADAGVPAPPADTRCDLPVGQGDTVGPAAAGPWVRVADAPGWVFPQTLDASDAPIGVTTHKAGEVYDAHVMRWDGSAFIELGQLPESPACAGIKPSAARVARDPGGRLVAALQECDGTWTASFDGQWQLLGGVPGGSVWTHALAVDASGRPALVWTSDAHSPTRLRVGHETGAVWDEIGVFPENALAASIAFTSAGPVVASLLYPLEGGIFSGMTVHAWNAS